MTSLSKTESNFYWCGLFFDGMLLSAPISVRTNADRTLDLISVIIFVCVISAIIIHIILRIRGKAKNNNVK